MNAKDADEGKNAEISYFMANPEEVDDYFAVDAKSGLIKVSKNLKCNSDHVDLTEKGKEKDCLPCLRDVKLCSLIVVATDGGQPRQSAQTVVKIGLLDTNDHDPAITFNVFPKTNNPEKEVIPFASVNENAKVGTNVAIISVNDEDRGIHGQTSLEIIGKKHALKKYDQFSLNTSCFWRSTGSNITPIVQFHEILQKLLIN